MADMKGILAADAGPFNRTLDESVRTAESSLDRLSRSTRESARQAETFYDAAHRKIGNGWNGVFRTGAVAMGTFTAILTGASAAVRAYGDEFAYARDQADQLTASQRAIGTDIGRHWTPTAGMGAGALDIGRQWYNAGIYAATALMTFSHEAAQTYQDTPKENERMDIEAAANTQATIIRNQQEAEALRMKGDEAGAREVEGRLREQQFNLTLNAAREEIDKLRARGESPGNEHFARAADTLEGLLNEQESRFTDGETLRESRRAADEAAAQARAMHSLQDDIDQREIALLESQGRTIEARLARIDLDAARQDRAIAAADISEADRRRLVDDLVSVTDRARAQAILGDPASPDVGHEPRSIEAGLGPGLVDAVFGRNFVYGTGNVDKKMEASTASIDRNVRKIASGGLKIKLVLG